MEPEKEKTERLNSQRRRVPDWLMGTPEARIPRSDLEDRQPEPKRARFSGIVMAKNCEITHEQLCELLKYAVLAAPVIERPRWCQLLYGKQLSRTVVVILQGMSQLHFYRFYLEFGFLRKAFRHKFRLPPPSPTFLADVIGLPNQAAGYLPKTTGGSVPSAGTKPEVDLQNDPVIQKYGSQKVGLLRCLLTEEEMRTFDFPFQGSPDCENFVPTRCDGSVTENSPLFGLDGEMCITSKGRELTRISLVAEGGSCLLDELVKPDEEIVDYATCYSGITEEMLKPVTTKLKDVQRRLKALLPPDAVLVGHSLDVDLRALHMIHPYVIDTSLLYARERGRRFKLKFLAKAVLGKDIQRSERDGHDPTEDAAATLELAQHFLRYGPRKIAELNLEALWRAQDPRNARGKFHFTYRGALRSFDPGHHKLLFVSRETDDVELPSPEDCETVKCLSNREVFEQARRQVRLYPFSVIRFSLEPFSPLLTEEVNQRMRMKWTEMSTVYAGPLSKDWNLSALKRLFRSFGPVRTMTAVLETHQPHLSIEYEV
ncbi:RNA exonuclease 5-like [Urocitellus parryii]